jgi:hypothetical protein
VEKGSRQTFVPETARDNPCFRASIAILLRDWNLLGDNFFFGGKFFSFTVCVLLIFYIVVGALTVATNLNWFWHNYLWFGYDMQDFWFGYDWQNFRFKRFRLNNDKLSFNFLLLLFFFDYAFWLWRRFRGENTKRFLDRYCLLSRGSLFLRGYIGLFVYHPHLSLQFLLLTF